MKRVEDLTLEALWDLFPIVFKEYDPKYKTIYAEEANRLELLLFEVDIKRLSHIGSTAVVDIMSKPIIDILVEIADVNTLDIIKSTLINNGWILMNESVMPFKISFNKGYTIHGYAEKVFHLHVKRYGECDELYFRDYLNEHPEAKKTYETLKKDLLRRHPKNRDAYTKNKSDFVYEIVEKAKKYYNFRYHVNPINRLE